MDSDKVHDTWGDDTADEYDDELLHDALRALDWRDGESADEEAPSVAWIELADKR